MGRGLKVRHDWDATVSTLFLTLFPLKIISQKNYGPQTSCPHFHLCMGFLKAVPFFFLSDPYQGAIFILTG